MVWPTNGSRTAKEQNSILNQFSKKQTSGKSET